MNPNKEPQRNISKLPRGAFAAAVLTATAATGAPYLSDHDPAQGIAHVIESFDDTQDLPDPQDYKVVIDDQEAEVMNGDQVTDQDSGSQEATVDQSDIPPEILKKLAENTVYFSPVGCSGLIIRNSEGIPIGALTAEHCGFRKDNLERHSEQDGTFYVETPQPLTLKTGDSISGLTEVGVVTSFLAPKKGDTKNDTAFVAFGDNNPSDVFDAINEPPTLIQGDIAYMSGWPTDQDNNSGEMRRQVWQMTYIGTGVSNTDNGESLENALFFAMKSNPQGAECSFGASGSGAVNKLGKLIGPLAAFDELTPDMLGDTREESDKKRKQYEAQFGIDLSEFDAICTISPLPKIEDLDRIEVRNIDAEINATLSQEELEDEAIAEFFDPNVQKSYINGYIDVFAPDDSDDQTSHILNPVVYTHKTGETILYWQDPSQLNGFDSIYLNHGGKSAVLNAYSLEQDIAEVLVPFTSFYQGKTGRFILLGDGDNDGDEPVACIEQEIPESLTTFKVSVEDNSPIVSKSK